MEEEEDQFARKLFCLRCRTSVPIFSSVSRLSFLQLAREGTDRQRREGEVVQECQDRIALRPAGAAAAAVARYRFSLLPSKSTTVRLPAPFSS